MNKENIPLIILIALLSLIILGGSAFAVYMATNNKSVKTQTDQAVVVGAGTPTAKAKQDTSTKASTNDSTDASLTADLAASDKDLEAVSSDAAQSDASLTDTQTDLSE